MCEHAVKIYVNMYQKCFFRFKCNEPCIVRPAELHDQHLSANGQRRYGNFHHDRHWDMLRINDWTREIRAHIVQWYRDLWASYEGFYLSSEERDDKVRQKRERVLQEYHDHWKSIRSNKSCLACLQAVPDHVLGCRHAFYPQCVQELGQP
jgi:hypothetical protein